MPTINNETESPKKTHSKSERVQKTLGIILLSALVILFVMVSYYFYTTSGLIKIAKAQLEALRAGNFIKAYSFTAKDFQKKSSIEEFKNFLKQYPSLKHNKKAYFTVREIDEGVGKLKGRLTATDGAITPVEYVFIKEDDQWKILSLQVSPVGVNIKENFDHTSIVQQDFGNQLTNTLDNAEHHYSIKYPKNWSYEKKNYVVLFRGIKGDLSHYSTINVQVIATKKTGGHFATLSEFMEDLKSQFELSSPDINIIEQGSLVLTTDSGHHLQGEYLHVSYTFRDERFEQLSFVFLSNDQKYFYAFIYTSPEAQYHVDLPIAKAMFKSWIIK